MGRKILVTGGAGYLGSMLCHKLVARGDLVTAVDDASRGGFGLHGLLGEPNFSLVIEDFQRGSIMRDLAGRADVVVHLAALVGQPACDDDPVRARRVNLEGVKKLVECVPSDKPLIFASTSSVYGKSSLAVCDEYSDTNPVSLYSELKLLAEEVVMDRPDSVVIRPATLYGASGSMRLDLLPHQMVKEAMTTGLITVYEPQRLRSFLHVRDAVAAVSYLLQIPSRRLHGLRRQDRVVNLADQESHISKGDLASMIAGMLRSSIEVREGYADPDQRDYRVTSSSELAPRLETPVTLPHGLMEVVTAFRLLPRWIDSGGVDAFATARS